jgi:hypothetical protein
MSWRHEHLVVAREPAWKVSFWHILYRSPTHSAPGDLYWRRRSQIDLFGNSQGVVDLYSKVPHCAFQFRVAKQQLYRA